MCFAFQFPKTNIEEKIFQNFTHQLQLFSLHEKFMFSLLFKTENQNSLTFHSFPFKNYNQKIQASFHKTVEFKKYLYKSVILYRQYVILVSIIEGLVQLLVFLYILPPLFHPRLVPLPLKLLSPFVFLQKNSQNLLRLFVKSILLNTLCMSVNHACK